MVSVNFCNNKRRPNIRFKNLLTIQIFMNCRNKIFVFEKINKFEFLNGTFKIINLTKKIGKSRKFMNSFWHTHSILNWISGPINIYKIIYEEINSFIFVHQCAEINACSHTQIKLSCGLIGSYRAVMSHNRADNARDNTSLLLTPSRIARLLPLPPPST